MFAVQVVNEVGGADYEFTSDYLHLRLAAPLRTDLVPVRTACPRERGDVLGIERCARNRAKISALSRRQPPSRKASRAINQSLSPGQVARLAVARGPELSAMASKYAALSKRLAEAGDEPVELGIATIDRLVGGLPQSARKHVAFWANSRSHPHAATWLDVGRLVTRVELIPFDDHVIPSEVTGIGPC